MRWLALVLCALMAGCSDGGSAAGAEDDPFADLDTKPVASDKGLIRGVVFDPTITPIEGASVVVAAVGKETTTNVDGAFVINDLEPGIHFVSVSKVGYTTVQQSATVEAGVAAPPIVKVQLQQMPGTEPRAITYQDVGFIACGWGVPITYDYCGQYIGAEDDYRLQYEVFGTPTAVQVEVVWDNTQPLSANLYMINALCPAGNKNSCPGAISAGQRWDEGTWTSPAIMRTPAGLIENALERFEAEDMEGWWVGVDVSADGPALATGVTIDQEFTGYVTMFWNLDPDPAWTFSQDGEYPVPQ